MTETLIPTKEYSADSSFTNFYSPIETISNPFIPFDNDFTDFVGKDVAFGFDSLDAMINASLIYDAEDNDKKAFFSIKTVDEDTSKQESNTSVEVGDFARVGNILATNQNFYREVLNKVMVRAQSLQAACCPTNLKPTSTISTALSSLVSNDAGFNVVFTGFEDNDHSDKKHGHCAQCGADMLTDGICGKCKEGGE